MQIKITMKYKSNNYIKMLETANAENIENIILGPGR